MKLIEPGQGELDAGLAVAKYLGENAVAAAEAYADGTTFTPIGLEGGQVVVRVEEPGGGPARELRVAELEPVLPG
jgi:hypothetical protein